MKSRDYFEAFCRALESSPPQSRDREIFHRAKDVLQVCYDECADPKLCEALQRRACEIMLDISDPGEWDGASAIYGTAWRLCIVLPDNGAGLSGNGLDDPSGNGQSHDLSRRIQELEQLADQLNSELDIQPTATGEDEARIESLLTLLDGFGRTLLLVRDLAGGGVTPAVLFGTGTTGARLVDNLSDAVAAVLRNARDTVLEPLARELVRDIATGAGAFVSWIAEAAAGNSDLRASAKKFEDRIAPYLAEEAEGGGQRAFRDIAQPWCPEMVEIPPGDFLMGSGDPTYQDEIPLHPVKISHKFAVARNPVTFQEFDAFCQATGRQKPDDNGWGRDRRPVINVSWDDAQDYVAWLSGQTGMRYRLLTEAEWEYACRAGSATTYSFGDDDKNLAEHGWYVGSLDGETAPVGQRLASEFGLFDMHGNVWEWVEDVWHDNYSGTPPDDGSAWLEDGNQRIRVLRGGSWVSGANGLRSAVRVSGDTDYRHNNVGFRVARTR